ncbi:MAG: DUF1592 domain-containing protein, partial [Rubripirellula sp.]
SEEGNLNLEAISFDIGNDIPTAEQWAKVLNAINSGEMPPDDSEPISDNEKADFLADLSVQMVVARRILSDSGGMITMRRLNRREYQNTIESLLGVRPDVSALPDDQATSGFDTVGASLFFSSDQLEQYLGLARHALELAFQEPEAIKERLIHIEPEDEFSDLYAERASTYQDTIARSIAFQAQTEKPASAFGYVDKANAAKAMRGAKQFLPQFLDYLNRPETKRGATLISSIKSGITRIKLPAMGGRSTQKAVIRVRAGVYEGAPDRYRYLEFSQRVVGTDYSTHLGWRKVSGSVDEPQIVAFPVSVNAGERVQFFVHQRTHQGRGDKNLWTLDREKNVLGTPPGLWVDWVELEQSGDADAIQGIAKEILFEKPPSWSDEDYAREVIRRFAVRAFRTEEPANEYLDKLFQRYVSGREKGLGPTDALVDPLSIVLSSPSFLYMIESTGGDASLTDPELAVRLSYLLWSTPPDDELMSIARQGELSDPSTLREQTTRLLADQRADRFLRSFVHQWLGMDRLGMFQFEARLFPTFDNSARESAREEIFQTMQTIMAERLPLSTLLKSDFVVINDVLADYYGIQGVEGHEFRKVSLPEGSPRGGLLGTAAVLAMGSDGIRSSPVERGAWVLRHVLNDPPPPAPPNVPQLSRLAGEVLAARELQRAHQEEPQCAQCHRKIDPIGYGLENFDAAGKWRDLEVVRSGNRNAKTKGFTIDASGRLPSGDEYESYIGLRNAVAECSDDFARGFTESLISYGLGRPYGFTDQRLANSILEQADAGNFEVSQFVHALVQSAEFRSK